MELKDYNTLNLISSIAREMHTAKATGLSNLEKQTASEVLPIIRGNILKLIAEDTFCFQRIKIRLVNELRSILEATNFLKVDLENLIKDISR